MALDADDRLQLDYDQTQQLLRTLTDIRFKLLAFVLSASLTGLAGSLKTLVMGFATLADVHWAMSGEVILMTLLGGVGTFFGPLLGSAIVVSMQTLLADKVGGWVTVIIGCVFVFCVLSFRKGIVGEVMGRLHRA